MNKDFLIIFHQIVRCVGLNMLLIIHGISLFEKTGQMIFGLYLLKYCLLKAYLKTLKTVKVVSIMQHVY